MITQLSAPKLEAMIWCTRFTYWNTIAGDARQDGDLTAYTIAHIGAQNAIRGLIKTGFTPSEMLEYVDDLEKKLLERKELQNSQIKAHQFPCSTVHPGQDVHHPEGHPTNED